MIQKLADEDALPTQLYLSTNASDYDSFLKINRPKYDDSWERWNKTLEMLAKLDTRTVLRVTLIKDWNDSEKTIPDFTSIFEKSNAHFVEIKSYMHIGRSTNRLEYENMVEMNDVRKFSGKIVEKSDRFEIMDESEVSRIVVLQNKKRFTDRYLSAYQETN
jgi:tRNA wybutosine-synthesizing protein 1